MKGYRVEGDEIVFSFDRRDYDKATSDESGKKYDFDDLDIENVVVSGEFNKWSTKKWKMTKVDENIYELRKKITDFTDEFSWEFKFVINNSYWAEPSDEDKNIVRATKNGSRLNVYNLKMYTAYPHDLGNASFILKGYQNAKKVVVSGSFNKWNENLFLMNKTEDGWSLKLQMKPGEYQYKFIVDGQWIADPHNLYKTTNEFGGYNSILNIKVPVDFILNGYPNAEKVILAGSFNNWSDNNYKMIRTKNGWKYTVSLSGGKHHYKYIIDDQWIVDPDNPVKEYDAEGNINSVCMVK
ncbi:glycogen-binding domain-containing protein [Aquimarina sp. MMG016]|uniref:glycogen-binding domain-containing protein n=1 Tax=Aquimarina sp. MMG016 TaxID=2822690 RepID=UPI001B3A00CE|nr:glycogen-binding domain-containing protein [Aquimarina sp. MMG016]MBQ4822522.1 glycogen-binding domain-containing protein [Aquimarina sp. MMG016]